MSEIPPTSPPSLALDSLTYDGIKWWNADQLRRVLISHGYTDAANFIDTAWVSAAPKPRKSWRERRKERA